MMRNDGNCLLKSYPSDNDQEEEFRGYLEIIDNEQENVQKTKDIMNNKTN